MKCKERSDGKLVLRKPNKCYFSGQLQHLTYTSGRKQHVTSLVNNVDKYTVKCKHCDTVRSVDKAPVVLYCQGDCKKNYVCDFELGSNKHWEVIKPHNVYGRDENEDPDEADDRDEQQENGTESDEEAVGSDDDDEHEWSSIIISYTSWIHTSIVQTYQGSLAPGTIICTSWKLASLLSQATFAISITSVEDGDNLLDRVALRANFMNYNQQTIIAF